MTIDAKSIANSGNWQPNAGSLSLTTQTDFSNSGKIQMDGDFRIRTIGNIANSGEILTGGTIRLAGQNVYNGNLLKADNQAGGVIQGDDMRRMIVQDHADSAFLRAVLIEILEQHVRGGVKFV